MTTYSTHTPAPITFLAIGAGQRATYKGRSCDMVRLGHVVVSSVRGPDGHCLEGPDFVTVAVISLNVPGWPQSVVPPTRRLSARGQQMPDDVADRYYARSRRGDREIDRG